MSKPRVFLSHASVDKPFIERIAGDLRRFGIDCWLDTEEIRAGKPWMNVIFEDGLPACDACLVYITESSLSSKMVAKEIDVAMLHEMSERSIRFLPYVKEPTMRGRIRSDLATLQIPVWNESNYDELLPAVISEVWLSYSEGTIRQATMTERTRRLELEVKLLEIERRLTASPFSAAEEADFEFILSKLDRPYEFTLNVIGKDHDRTFMHSAEIAVSVNALQLVYFDSLFQISAFEMSNLNRRLIDAAIAAAASKLNEGEKLEYGSGMRPTAIEARLLTCGLVADEIVQDSESRWSRRVVTTKMHRFRYWMEFRGMVSERLNVAVAERLPLG